MKKLMNIFVLVAIVAMALVSCQKPGVDNVEPQEYEYTFLMAMQIPRRLSVKIVLSGRLKTKLEHLTANQTMSTH